MAASRLTKIIDGDLPGRFVWEDDVCVAVLSETPVAPGHTVVAPREDVEHWLDASPQLRGHLFEVAHTIGLALQAAFRPGEVGLMVAGRVVDRLHIHLVPIDRVEEMDLARAEQDPADEALNAARDAIRGSLREMGADCVSDRG